MKLDEATFEAISEQARDAATLQELIPAAEPDGVYYLHNAATRQTERRVAEPVPLRVYALTLPDFAAAIVHQTSKSADADVLVTVSSYSVFAFTDGEQRRNSVRMRLTYTSQFSCLKGVQNRAFTHRELLRFLRVDLAGACSADVVNRLANLSFVNTEQGGLTQTPGKSHVNAAVLKTACFDGEPPPETIAVQPVVFEQFCEPKEARQRTVTCALDFEIEDRTFQLQPLAGELLAAEVTTLQDLQAMLETALTEVRSRQTTEGPEFLVVLGSV